MSVIGTSIAIFSFHWSTFALEQRKLIVEMQHWRTMADEICQFFLRQPYWCLNNFFCSQTETNLSWNELKTSQWVRFSRSFSSKVLKNPAPVPNSAISRYYNLHANCRVDAVWMWFMRWTVFTSRWNRAPFRGKKYFNCESLYVGNHNYVYRPMQLLLLAVSNPVVNVVIYAEHLTFS